MSGETSYKKKKRSKVHVYQPDLRNTLRVLSEVKFDYNELLFGLVEVPTKGAIRKRGLHGTPPEALFFQYIPTEMVEKYQATWNEVEATGRRKNALQFKSGRPREIEFDLWLNEWGMFRRDKGAIYTPEQTVQWFRSKMYPHGEGRRFEPPKVLALMCWEIVFVVVLDVEITRQHVRAVDAEPYRVVSGTDGRIRSDRAAGQMLRGVMSVKLKEYVPPPKALLYMSPNGR